MRVCMRRSKKNNVFNAKAFTVEKYFLREMFDQ